MLIALLITVLGWGHASVQAADSCAVPSFDLPALFNAGLAPVALAGGDFNGDGKLDVVAVSSGSSDVAVLLGDGAGAFAQPTFYTVGTRPEWVATGDFNHDGKSDIVVVNNGSQSVSVLLSDSAGSFAVTNYAVGIEPHSVAVGDFNADGNPDLAVTNGYSGTVSILAGNAQGGFATTATIGVSGTSVVAVADFNRDGRPDLAVAGRGTSAVGVLLNDGTGGFGAPTYVNTGSYNVQSVFVGDLNNDGNSDMVVTHYVSGRDLMLLFGDGHGGFGPPVQLPSGYNPTLVAVGDFNADGQTDLAVADAGVKIFTGAGAGAFNAPARYLPDGPLLVGDFNGDGRPDLAATSGGKLAVMLAKGAGAFGAARTYSTPIDPKTIAVGDLNGDGRADLVVAARDFRAVTVLLNEGAGAFSAPVSYTINDLGSAATIGDFNRDGRPDIAVTVLGPGGVIVLLGDGSGGFAAGGRFIAGAGSVAITTGDFNHDGIIDLATANVDSDDVSVLLGNGVGAFSLSATLITGRDPVAIIAGNFNGDTNPDLAVVNQYAEIISVFNGDGAGSFAVPTNYNVGHAPVALAAADFNGDTRPDLAVVNSTGASLSLLFANSAGGFSAGSPITTATAPSGVAVTDLNGDGKLDLAVSHRDGANGVSLLLGDGAGSFAPALFQPLGTSLGFVAAGDLNGDAKPDLAVLGANVSVLLNACGLRPDPTPTPTPNATYSISGRVVNGQSPFAFVNLSGTRTLLSGVDSNGSYSFTGLPAGGNYTVTPSHATGPYRYSYTPPSQTFNNLSANQIADFTETLQTFRISGRVTDASGHGIPNIQIIFNVGSGSAIFTDANGFYSQQLPAGQSYMVVPASLGYTFSPAQNFSNLSADQVANFIATPLYDVTGRVVDRRGNAVSGVFLFANGPITRSTTTDASGNYRLNQLLGGGNYTVTPTGGGNFLFEPASYTYASLSGNQTANFMAVRLYQLSGRVADAGGVGIPGALLSLTGTRTIATTTNADGSFLFANLPEGGDYRITALTGAAGSLFANFTLAPPLSQSFSNLAGNATVNFTGTRLNFGVGLTPKGIVAADLNRDGLTDLVVATVTGSSVRVLLGRGDGTFQPTVSYPAGGNPQAVVVRDFNGDGRLDLTVANSTSNDVTVLPGNGDGTFQAPARYVVGTLPLWLASGDFNGDGAPDLVTANYNGNTVSVLLNNGQGSFGAAVNYDTGPATAFVDANDLNGDGRADLVVATQGGVSVLLGRGDGTFLPSVNYAAGVSPFAVAVGDFDRDGRRDLAVANAGTTSNKISVLLGRGDGTFLSTVDYTVGSAPRSVVVGDFNRDGRDDLAAVNYSNNSVSVLPGIGDGTFRSAQSFSVGAFPQVATVGDFNGDGAPDLAVTNDSENGRVSVLLNTVSLGFQFTAQTFQAAEGDARATITITRTGDVSSTASVAFATIDDPAAVPCDPALVRSDGTPYPHGAAYARCDYATTVDTITFAAGQTTKVINVPLIDDAFIEGAETVQLQLANPAGAALGNQSTATLVITDNDTPGEPNPIFSTPFFVRMHYLDFLNREPEAGEPWSNVLNNCSDVNNNPACDRILVSQSFFGSPEFQLKGFYVFRFYKLAFNRLPEYLEIIPDMSFVAGATAAEVFQRKSQLAVNFTQRAEFQTTYGSLSNSAYVAALLNRYQLTQVTTPEPANPDGTQKVTLASADLGNRLTSNVLTRAQVFRAIADSDEVGAAEFNNAFVAMQYYGYLRRKPEAAGYQAWLQVLQSGNQRTMVNGFMNSSEYRLRFGQP